MFCSECGKEIPDTVRFCAYCGTPVEADETPEVPEQTDETPEVPEQTDETPEVPEQTDETPEVPEQTDKTPEVPEQADETPEVPEQTDETPEVPEQADETPEVPEQADEMPEVPIVSEGQKKKKSHKGIVFGILAVLAIMIVVCVFFAVRFIFSGSGIVDRVIYMKDDELSAILDIAAKEPADVEIERIRKPDGQYNIWAGYSEDGKYFYYFSKIDSDGEYGTLSRVQVDKLKKNESADGAIEEIDSKVSTWSGVSIIGNESVLYQRRGNELWLYRDGTTTELADSVSAYRVTEDQKYVIYTEQKEDDEDADLYWMEISEKAEAEEIDDHVTDLWAGEGCDSNFIVYTRKEECYVAGIDGSKSLVAEDVSMISGDADKSFYYTISESKEMPLYDYVIDSYAESDTQAKEPVLQDFMDKVDAATAIAEYDIEYYDSIEELLYSTGYYMDEYGLYEYYNYDTGEEFFYDDVTKTWYGNCNFDDYYMAQEDYNNIVLRNELRDELKQETVDQEYKILYQYQDGESELICENVSNIYSWDGKMAVYEKFDLESPRKMYPIDEIYEPGYLREEIQYGSGMEPEGEHEIEHEIYCHVAGSAEMELSDFDDVSGAYLHEDGKTLVVEGNINEDGSRELIQYTVGNDGLNDGETLTREGRWSGFHESMVYYWDNIFENEGDLYCYKDGEEKLVAKDASRNVFLADDGTVVGITDWNDDGTEGDLSIFDKDGKGEDLTKDVRGFRYLGSGTYLVMEEDDLYYLNKKGEKTRLARNITRYWYPGKLPGEWMYIS